MIMVHIVSNPSSYPTWEVDFSSFQLSCRKDTYVVIPIGRQLYIEELETHRTVSFSRTRPVLCCAMLHVQCGFQACAVLHKFSGHRINLVS